jgi:hypothetical protein
MGTPSQWSAGVDAITLTIKDDSDDAYGRWGALGAAMVADVMTGEFEAVSAMKRGYIGVRVHPSVFVGRMRGQGLMLTVTGGISASAARYFCDADNCSRIDMQVTVWSDVSCDERVMWAFKHADANRKSGTFKGRPYRVRHEETAGDGNTTYLGARTSEIFGRVYNKEAQSHEPLYEGAVRYEVELAGGAAWRAYGLVAGKASPAGICTDIVHKCFTRWGVPFPWRLCDLTPFVSHLPVEPFDVERKLSWLRHQVSPTVEKLMSCGVNPETVVDALFEEASMTPAVKEAMLRYVSPAEQICS